MIAIPIVLPGFEFGVGAPLGTGTDEEWAERAVEFAVEDAISTAERRIGSCRLTSAADAQLTVADLLVNDRAGTTTVIGWTDTAIKLTSVGPTVVNVAASTADGLATDRASLAAWCDAVQQHMHSASPTKVLTVIDDGASKRQTTSRIDTMDYTDDHAELMLDVGYCTVVPPDMAGSTEFAAALERLPSVLHAERHDRLVLFGDPADWIGDDADEIRSLARSSLAGFVA